MEKLKEGRAILTVRAKDVKQYRRLFGKITVHANAETPPNHYANYSTLSGRISADWSR